MFVHLVWLSEHSFLWRNKCVCVCACLLIEFDFWKLEVLVCVCECICLPLCVCVCVCMFVYFEFCKTGVYAHVWLLQNSCRGIGLCVHVCPSSLSFITAISAEVLVCVHVWLLQVSYWCMHICPSSLTFGKVTSVEALVCVCVRACMFDFCNSQRYWCVHIQFDVWKVIFVEVRLFLASQRCWCVHVCPLSLTFGSHLCTGTSACACLSFASWRYWCVHVCPFSLIFGKVISVQVPVHVWLLQVRGTSVCTFAHAAWLLEVVFVEVLVCVCVCTFDFWHCDIQNDWAHNGGYFDTQGNKPCYWHHTQQGLLCHTTNLVTGSTHNRGYFATQGNKPCHWQHIAVPKSQGTIVLLVQQWQRAANK